MARIAVSSLLKGLIQLAKNLNYLEGHQHTLINSASTVNSFENQQCASQVHLLILLYIQNRMCSGAHGATEL